MITLDNFTDTQKLIFADAFETMTCGNLTLDCQYATEEEKKFDSKGRLSERRFLYPNSKGLKLREVYDYEHSYINCSFYELSEEILNFILPFYTDEEKRTMITPIKERVLQLGFPPEQIEKIAFHQKCDDRKSLTSQEVWTGCEGFFTKGNRTDLESFTYDEKGKKLFIEEYDSAWGEKRFRRYTFDHNGNTIMKRNSWVTDDWPTLKTSIYDDKNRLLEKSGVHYQYNRENVTLLTFPTPRTFTSEGYIRTIRKDNYTETIEHYSNGRRIEETISTFDHKKRLVKKVKRTYYENWEKIRKGKYTLKKEEQYEWTEEYTYNEAGVLEKEVRRYVDKDNDYFISGDYYTIEIILYNEQGQKVERNKKTEHKNCFDSFKFEYKDKIFLEHTLYYYDSEGNLTREELKKWRADEGAETEVEYLTIYHFYVKDDEYEEHLEVTVKKIH
ncbi:hypothetical protein [Capnocytophaga granulosa]|uniref:hypothetical protein n=1 Tax=Capnocytophaga granulosa TaxID=45242 RepID=UPI0023F2D43A|nr:hypothetical protein [Capnocytophaga granulosa]